MSSASIIYENKETENCIWYYYYDNKVTKETGLNGNTEMSIIELPLEYDVEFEKNVNEQNGYMVIINKNR